MVKGPKAKHWRSLWKQTVGTWWDMVVDLRGSALAYVLPTLKRRVLKSSWEQKHRLIHLSSALGLYTPFAPVLWTTTEQHEHAAALIPQDGRKTLAIAPAANWGAKQWPADRFAQVALKLTGPGGKLEGAKIAVLAAPTEAQVGQAVLNVLPENSRIDLIGKVDLPGLGACLARCDLFIGNDSGLMHLAAASGCPTLGLFGPSSEIFYGPWGPKTASVRGPRSFEDICHAPDYNYRSHECLMLDLTVDKVVEAAERLVE
jgi:ADP-heptose:LPS heptosyltransferase